MAPRKDKKKMIDVGEASSAANKRTRRNEILNATNGVPFTTPITQFPFTNMFPIHETQNTNVFATHLQFSPPSPIQHEEEEDETTADDGFISWIIPQQNFIINYHMNQMLQSVEEFWRRNLAGEIKKRTDLETKLKQKEEQADRFRQMYHYYEKRTFHLEEMLQQRVDADRCNAAPPIAPQEEVQSCLVDLNTVPRMDLKCQNCRNRPATMLWLPCRHLCVCLVCERRVKACPICSVKKIESLKINLP
ncbi:hypothetical protein QVD17_23657 [Tagetes erecta]|uniref:RING-type domain-containing protein n=1 Tax=Tagetes erecta TaxID=13708 RepID=A0AAD8KGX5_TARER|nr:hypothetical protein QVD17_23657 [Tagetes erecta]